MDQQRAGGAELRHPRGPEAQPAPSGVLCWSGGGVSREPMERWERRARVGSSAAARRSDGSCGLRLRQTVHGGFDGRRAVATYSRRTDTTAARDAQPRGAAAQPRHGWEEARRQQLEKLKGDSQKLLKQKNQFNPLMKQFCTYSLPPNITSLR